MREIVLPPVARYRGPQSPLIYNVLTAKNKPTSIGSSPNWPMRKTQLLFCNYFSVCIVLPDSNASIGRATKLVALSGKHKFLLFSLLG